MKLEQYTRRPCADTHENSQPGPLGQVDPLTASMRNGHSLVGPIDLRLSRGGVNPPWHATTRIVDQGAQHRVTIHCHTQRTLQRFAAQDTGESHVKRERRRVLIPIVVPVVGFQGSEKERQRHGWLSN